MLEQDGRAEADQRKAAAYNLFYADIEADAKARVAALEAQRAAAPS